MTNFSASINRLLVDKDIDGLKMALNSLSGFEIAEIISNKKFEDQLVVFTILDPKLAAETFDYFPIRTQKKLLHSLPSVVAAKLLTSMLADDRTAFLQELPKSVVDEYLKNIPFEERTLSLELLDFPEESVGRLMTTDYIAIKMSWNVEQVLDHIRDYGFYSEIIDVIYAVDDNDILLDDFKTKDFLFYPKDYKVAQLSDRKFIALSAYDKAENAVNIFNEHDRVALPVVDKNGALLGIVTIDDILRYASEKSTEEMQQVGGTEALDEPYMDTPFLELMKKRSRWLVMLFIGEMLTATAMGFFQDEIAQAVILALFLPLIISSGGNAGSQSSTLIVRAMALGEVRVKDWWHVMKREIFSGAFLGCVLGVIGFIRVALWGSVSNVYGEHWLLVAFTISLSLVAVVLWGSLIGSMLPIALRRLGTDPAVSSAPLVATLVDVVGIIFYFTIAMMILKGSLL